MKKRKKELPTSKDFEKTLKICEKNRFKKFFCEKRFQKIA